MIERLVTLLFHRRIIVWMVFAFVAAYGMYCWTQLPLEAYPDIADTTSQVVTQVEGLAAEEVEKQITIPLEREIMGTPGMYVMRSKSTFGLSLITVVFRDGAEDYWSRQRLQERIAGVTLPYGAQPGLDALTSPIGEIYRYTLESKTRDLRALSEPAVLESNPAPEAGGRTCRRVQFWRHHDAVPAQARSGEDEQVQRQPHANYAGHQQ